MATTALDRSSTLRAVLSALLLLAGGCASSRQPMPTAAEKLDFQGAVSDSLAAAADLPLDEDAIHAFLERFLAEHPGVYGSTYALDPAHAGRQLAPYVHRAADRLVRKSLAVDGYGYSSLAWFTEPMRRKAPVWSEPYFDAGGGEIMMVTYSAPVLKDGRPIGVLTADFALED